MRPVPGLAAVAVAVTLVATNLAQSASVPNTGFDAATSPQALSCKALPEILKKVLAAGVATDGQALEISDTYAVHYSAGANPTAAELYADIPAANFLPSDDRDGAIKASDGWGKEEVIADDGYGEQGSTSCAQQGGLPSFCRVGGFVRTSEKGSKAQFEVWMPLPDNPKSEAAETSGDDAAAPNAIDEVDISDVAKGFKCASTSGWSKRLVFSVGGGMRGAAAYPEMKQTMARYRTAVAGTNMGHFSAQDGTAWLPANEEAWTDYGHRAVHLTSRVAQQAVRIFYDAEPNLSASKEKTKKPVFYSYFKGCSTGGRAAMASAQRYPKDFDGIMAGSPAMDFNNLKAFQIHVNSFLADKKSPGYIPTSAYKLINQAVLQACDAQDGVKDKIVSGQVPCEPNFAELIGCTKLGLRPYADDKEEAKSSDAAEGAAAAKDEKVADASGKSVNDDTATEETKGAAAKTSKDAGATGKDEKIAGTADKSANDNAASKDTQGDAATKESKGAGATAQEVNDVGPASKDEADAVATPKTKRDTLATYKDEKAAEATPKVEQDAGAANKVVQDDVVASKEPKADAAAAKESKDDAAAKEPKDDAAAAKESKDDAATKASAGEGASEGTKSKKGDAADSKDKEDKKPAPVCLTDPQLETLKNILSPYKIDNDLISEGVSAPSVFGWTVTNAITGKFGSSPTGWFQFQVLGEKDPKAEFNATEKVTPEVIRTGQRLDPGGTITFNADLGEFFDNGGKLLHYHGLDDSLVPPMVSRRYYEQVLAKVGDKARSAYKLYLIPGMLHCRGGTGCWNFGGAGQSEAGSRPLRYDDKHDMFVALTQWVEKGVAPNVLIGAAYKNKDGDVPATSGDDTPFSNGVRLTRPLCPYPTSVRLQENKKNTDDASAFQCS